MSTKDFQFIIIGSGVIGLAIARSLAEYGYKSVLVIDKNEKIGQGISSRNSEVIHSGIYYPPRSLKAKYCIRGRQLLYDFCDKQAVWLRKTGKLIVANNNQLTELKKLYHNAIQNGINDVKIIDDFEINELEPNIKADKGLLINCSGILCAHELMNAFHRISINQGHDYLFKTEVISSKIISEGYKTEIKNSYGEIESVTSQWIINCGGLNSDVIARYIQKNSNLPFITFSKGCYFKLSSNWRNKFKHLVYPIPDKKNGGLGIHLSYDKDGYAKLGPNAKWLKNKEENYEVEETLKDIFFEEASKYILGLSKDEISPDYSGIRPKIKSSTRLFSDYYIQHEKNKGYPNWVNLIGIESPGLTSAIAIGDDIVENIIMIS